ncbi:MAG: hypothetical protein ACOYKE_11995 [Ferruginibacter sp.]
MPFNKNKFTAMYENKRQKLASQKVYFQRIGKNAIAGSIIILFCLYLGMIGYKITIPEFDWYDSLLNASMILSGMGPIIDSKIVLTKSAKVFASVYAIFSGIMFISTIGLLLAPIAHRFFHKLHLEDE